MAIYGLLKIPGMVGSGNHPVNGPILAKSKAHPARLARKGRRGRLVLKAIQDRKGRPGRKAQRVSKAQPVRKVLPGR